jgi:hypothetical protein
VLAGAYKTFERRQHTEMYLSALKAQDRDEGKIESPPIWRYIREVKIPRFRCTGTSSAGLDNIFSCLRAKFKMCLQKHVLFRFCDINIVKMSVF